MLSLKEYIKFSEMSEEELNLDEALNFAARQSLKRAIRKNKGKIKIGRERAARKIASPEKLKMRAQKQARKSIEKKILKDKSKEELSFQQRGELEKRIDKRKAVINQLAKKLLPKIKKAEIEKKRGVGTSE